MSTRNISFQDLFIKPVGAAAACVGEPISSLELMRTPSPGVGTPSGSQKGSIDFILGGGASIASTSRTPTGGRKYDPTRDDQLDLGDADEENRAFDPRQVVAVKQELRARASQEVRLPMLATGTRAEPLAAAAATSAPKRKKKRKARICKELGCDKYVVDHGLCIRHGGGKRCNVEGCNCRAQNRGLCWKHGGYTICKVEGCAKRAKSRGICWSHGGGTRCKTEGCTKIAVSLGRCWAHGGGKRCEIEGCRKPASERTNNLCADHFAWSQRDAYDAPPSLAGP